MQLRPPTSDELPWLVLIYDTSPPTAAPPDEEWHETEDEAKQAATTALESHATRVYVCRCRHIGEP
jgi:hypothetical protein